MSRFAKLLESSNQESETEEVNTPTIPLGRFGDVAESFDITEDGPYTESAYSVVQMPCSSQCDTPILNIIDPVYDLEVGQSHSIPLELVFTELKPEIKTEGDVGHWQHHHLAGDSFYEFTCPTCSKPSRFVICPDGGILALTGESKEVEIPVPKNRIGYMNRPKKDWSVVE